MLARWASMPRGLAAASVLAAACAAHAGEPALAIVGDGLPQPLTAVAGDPVRGRAIVADRRVGLCTLCHPAPLPEPTQHGNLAPSLADVAGRLSEAQLRLRVADARALNPASLMPTYFGPPRGERVAVAFAGRSVLDAQQIEDVVAYLRTLR